MYLIKTALQGTSFTIQFVKDQQNSCPADIDLTKTTIKAPEFKHLAKFPVGTVFAVNDITWGDVNSIIVGSVRPLCTEDKIVASTALPVDNIATNGDVDYLLNWIIADKDQGGDVAKVFAEKFASLGYTVPDIDEKIKEYMSAPTGNLKEQIMKIYPCPKESDTGFHIEPELWYLLIRNVLKGENTLLIGPTGSGKTEIVSYVAKALSKELSIQDMGTIQDAQSALLGVHRLNKEGHSDFDFAPFVGHVQKEGIVLLDELNRAPLSAANILFPCLDKRRYLPIDIANGEGERSITINEKCVFFATANLGSEYSGTTQIDRALLDRFFPVELTYPSEKAEIAVLMHRTGVNEKVAKSIVKVSSTIRTQFKNEELSNAISVRHTLLVASLIKDGFDVVTALTKVIMPLFEDGMDGATSERTKIKSIIAAN